MAITPTQFNLAPGWSDQDFADGLEDALLDAGVAQADIFKQSGGGSTIYGCIWKTTYNSGVGTYSSSFNAIRMSGSSVYFHRWLDVDLTTGITSGDIYLDYGQANILSTNGGMFLTSLAQNANAFFRVWTSAIDTDFSVIEFQNASNQMAFWTVPPSANFSSWVNFNERSFNSVFFPTFYSAGYYMKYHAIQNVHHRRDIQMGSGAGWTSSSYPAYTYHAQYSYLLPSNYTGSSSSSFPYQNQDDPWNDNNNTQIYVTIPAANSLQVPSLGTARYQPMIKGMPYCGYCDHTLPADFGVVPIDTNGLAPGDKFVVQSGVEEYEALIVRNQINSDSFRTSGAFVARIV